MVGQLTQVLLIGVPTFVGTIILGTPGASRRIGMTLVRGGQATVRTVARVSRALPPGVRASKTRALKSELAFFIGLNIFRGGAALGIVPNPDIVFEEARAGLSRSAEAIRRDERLQFALVSGGLAVLGLTAISVSLGTAGALPLAGIALEIALAGPPSELPDIVG